MILLVSVAVLVLLVLVAAGCVAYVVVRAAAQVSTRQSELFDAWQERKRAEASSSDTPDLAA